MEVHHHPHVPHGRKKFVEYLLEFMMIFLAITMGYFAESFREHLTEKKLEREFIGALVKELKSDSKQITNVLNDTVSFKKLDTLGLFLLGRNYDNENTKRIYELSSYTGNYNGIIFNRNTLSQLKSTGNMRLIHKRNIVDSINLLDNLISTANIQLNDVRDIVMGNIKDMSQVLDFGMFVKDMKMIPMDEVFNRNPHLNFLTNDSSKILKFGYEVMLQSGVIKNYYAMLNNVYELQERLIPFLMKEYHIKNIE